ncbi:hypothetical protein NBRC116493_24280 [Aurantivibrio infirmus]
MRFSSDHFKDVQRWGFRRFLYAAILWRVGAWLRFSYVFVRELESDPKLPPLSEGRVVRLASIDELLTAAQDPILDLDRDFVTAAVARGEQCSAVFQGDQIIAYAWEATRATPHTNFVTVCFEKPYRYRFNAFTHPAFRQQNLQHIISLYTDPMFIKQGYRYVISFIETHNYPSVSSNLSRGNIIVGYAGYLKLWRKVFCFRTKGARRVGFKFVANYLR